MRRLLAGLFSVAIGGAIATAAGAAPAAPPRIVLAVDGVGQTRNLPLIVAERLDYFRDAGLTVTLVDAPAEPGVDQLLVDGRVDGGVAFYHHTFMTQTQARTPTRAVLLMGASPQLTLVVASRLRDQVRSVADLKGRRIFVGGVNSGKTTTMNWLAARAGMTHADFTALEPTRAEAMAAALRDGAADAVIAHEPDAASYLASGAAFQLADLNSVEGTRAALGSIYPSTSLYMTDAYIDAHQQDVARLVAACQRALGFINSHSAEQIAAILPPRMVGADRPAFVAMLAKDKQAFATDGKLPVEAARQQLNIMAARSAKYQAVDLSRTYTNSFVKP